MKLSKKKKISHLKNQSKLILLSCFLLLATFAQAQQNLSFKDLSDKEVLDKLCDKLGITLNYNHDILNDESHNFSASGSSDEIISIIEKKLNLQFQLLEGDIFAVGRSTERNSSIEPNIYLTIIDEEGHALPFCNILIPNLDRFFQSNEKGEVNIKGFFADQEAIQFSYIGHENYYTTIKELSQKKKIILKNAAHVLGEITITEFLSSVQSNDLENKDQLQDIDIAGLSDQDLLNKAQLLPGIHSTSESLNDLQIRGGPPDQVSYKWNEIRLLQTSLFYGKVSGVNPFLVDDISITRNGPSADQSGQASGSILLDSSDKIKDKLKINFFADLLYANIGLDLPLIKEKLSAKVAYRRSHNYLFNTKIYNNYFDQTFQFGQLTNDQFYIDFYDIRGQEDIIKRFKFDDFSANINWKPTSKFILSSSFINLGNQFQYDYFDGNFNNETKRDQLNLSNIGWSAKAKYVILPQLVLSGIYNASKYTNHYNFIRDVGKSFGEDRFKENDVNQNQIRVDLSYRSKVAEFNIGVQSEKWQVSFLDTTRVSSLGLSYITDNQSTNERSAFIKAKWKFIENTLIETGLRYSDFGLSLVDRKFIEPRIHISHRIKPKLTLHAHYGKFHQNLNRRLFSTPLEVEKGIWYLSDERPISDNFIWVVQNTQSSIGLKYLISNWKFTIDLYTKKAENIWTSALDFAVEEDPFAFADLSVNGMEFSSHYQSKAWKTLWTYELTDETMTIKRGDEYDTKSPFTQRHKISLMQSYKLGNFTFSGRWRYNSGRRYSEGKNFYIQTEPELYYGLEYESILENQIDAYHSLDASIQYNWKFNPEKQRKIEIGFHVQNLYNRRNIIKRQYFIDYTKTPFEMSYYDRLGIPLTPNLSVRYSGN